METFETETVHGFKLNNFLSYLESNSILVDSR